MARILSLTLATVLAAGLSCPAEDKDFSGQDLKNKDYTDGNLQRAKFDCSDLRHANFNHALLAKASFVGAKLQNANLRKADLSGADFTDAHLEAASLTDAKAWDACFKNCVIFLARAEPHDFELIVNQLKADYGAIDIMRAYDEAECGSLSFRRANLQNTLFYGNAAKVDFLDADLRGADFGHVENLDQAVLRGAKYDEETRWTIDPEKMGAVFVHSDRPPPPPLHPLCGKWIILKSDNEKREHGVLYVYRDGIFQWDMELSKDNPKLLSGEWKAVGDKKDTIQLTVEATGEVWTGELLASKETRKIGLTSTTGSNRLGIGE